MATKKRNMLIAVDFGTTFTGVAYSDPSNEAAEPILFVAWPGRSCDKVPSIIRYNASDNIKGLLGIKWGNLVKSGQRRHEWFKLGLDPMQLRGQSSIDMSIEYPSKEEESLEFQRKAQDLTTDFLRKVREHVTKTLEENYGSVVFNSFRIQWMMTVPAIWSLEAKNATKRCAEAAGMGKREELLMTSEPEAGAVYALKKLEPHHLRIGHNIVILDAGGGTVDLVTYRIKQLVPHLIVEESGVTGGGKCGGVFVNRVFESMLDQKLKKANGEILDSARFEMRKHFEEFSKKEFDPDEEDVDWIPIPGVRDNGKVGIRGGRLKVVPREMVLCFDKVIDNVVQLARSQVAGVVSPTHNPSVNAIVLIGGFGECRYLKKRLINEPALSGIAVLKPPNTWTAIVRGAVMRGLQDRSGEPEMRMVASRLSQSTIGVVHVSPFVEGKHRSSHKYWDPYEGIYQCKDLLSCFVKKLGTHREGFPITYEFYRNIPVLGGSFIFEDEAYLLGILKTDLSAIPKFQLQKIAGKNGTQCYKVKYTLEAILSDVDMKLSVNVNGTQYSTVQLDYENPARSRPVRIF
ncbi:hypothetical protein BGZ60DRAFT_523585 [Tricladium varicosporioides]|nr:hypothetical protein BGZ60DRAFT_523585 [Hymenoscyphus varicosporioides]